MNKLNAAMALLLLLLTAFNGQSQTTKPAMVCGTVEQMRKVYTDAKLYQNEKDKNLYLDSSNQALQTRVAVAQNELQAYQQKDSIYEQQLLLLKSETHDYQSEKGILQGAVEAAANEVRKAHRKTKVAAGIGLAGIITTFIVSVLLK